MEESGRSVLAERRGEPGLRVRKAKIRVNTGKVGLTTCYPRTRGKLPILAIPAWGARILVESGSGITVIDVKALQGTAKGKRGGNSELQEGDRTAGDKAGARCTHPDHEYMMILGGDLLTAVVGTMEVSARSWKIRLERKPTRAEVG
jgi:hypothetical protein